MPAAASAFLVSVVKFEVSAVMTAPARSRLPGWGGVRCDWSGKEHNREQSGPMAEWWAEGSRLITKRGSVRRAEAGERPANQQTWNTELLNVRSPGDRQTRHSLFYFMIRLKSKESKEFLVCGLHWRQINKNWNVQRLSRFSGFYRNERVYDDL